MQLAIPMNFTALDHLIATVTLKSSESGGRNGPTPRDVFGCIVQVDGLFVDCKMLLGGPIAPGGEQRAVKMALMSSHNVFSKRDVGERLDLYEGSKRIGFATITGLTRAKH